VGVELVVLPASADDNIVFAALRQEAADGGALLSTRADAGAGFRKLGLEGM
jgi:hypothetical protein